MELVYVANIILMWYIFKFLSFVWHFSLQYIAPLFGYTHDLRKYGEWVVVTGCTDGIGLQYALQLAARGFNIVLISRSEEKLQTVSNGIIAKFHVKTKIIVYDFTKIDGYKNIAKELENLDVGILVNNVGTHYSGLVLQGKNDLQRTFDVMTVNMFSCVGVSHAVIEGMCERKRGLIIHISSIYSKVHFPMMDVYPATKNFMNNFVKCFSRENEGIIDHQLVLPGYVETKLSGVNARFFVCPTPADYVRSAINTIGFANITCGYWHTNCTKKFSRYCLPLQNFLRNKIKELHSGINLD